MQKEIKAARQPLAPEAREYSDVLTPQKMLKKYPEKLGKTEKGMLKGFEQRFKSNQSKKHTKHSKRTNSAKVDEKSPPAHTHPEGIRWIKNLREQNNEQRMRMAKQMTKRK